MFILLKDQGDPLAHDDNHNNSEEIWETLDVVFLFHTCILQDRLAGGGGFIFG